MAFERVQIPLTSGLRDDASDLDIEVPGLAIAKNVVFSKTGAVSPRPSLNSENGTLVTHGVRDSSSFGDLGFALNERLGLCGDDERLLLIESGSCFHRRTATNTWNQTGPMWSVTTTKDALVGSNFIRPRHFVPHVGTSIIGWPTTSPIGNYSTSGGLPAAPGLEVQQWVDHNSRCVAGDSLFLTSGVNVYMLRGHPVETTVLLASNALNSPAGTDEEDFAPQRLWALSHLGGYYVLYQASAACILLSLDTAGVQIGSLVLTKGQLASGNPRLAISMGFDEGLNNLIIAACGIDNQLATYRIDRSTLVDLNNDSVLTGAAGEMFDSPTVGVVDGGNTAFVAVRRINTAAFSLTHHSIDVYRRSASSGTPGLTLHYTFAGQPSATSFDEAPTGYLNWFAPTLFHGRLVMGLYYIRPNKFPFFILPATWMVIDITSASQPIFVACGEAEEALSVVRPSSAALLPSGALRCVYLTGTSFDVDGPKGIRAQAMTLQATPPQSASANGLTYFSGQVSYVFDGENTFEAGFPIRPVITVTPTLGTLGPGSRTFSAILVSVDSQGNLHRSEPAEKVTLTLGPSEGVNITVSLPPATGRRVSSMAIEVYMTVNNPSAEADLYNARDEERVLITNLFTHSQTVLVSDPPVSGLTVRTALYTGGRILPDQRPLANSGIAVIGSRVWCADGQRAMASKFVQSGIAPGWATDVSDLTLTVPTGYGPIRGISGFDNLLVLLCKNAVCVFTGQGPGDAGGPSDFSEPRQVYRASGPLRPCDVTVTRESVYWVSDKGDAHAFGQAVKGYQLSRPAGSHVLTKPAFIPGNGTRHDLLVFATSNTSVLVFLDLDLNLWGTWELHAPVRDIVASRAGLHGLFDDEPYVGSYTDYTGTGSDNFVGGPGFPFEQHIETKLVPLGHLGRVKSLQPKGRYANDLFSDDLELTVYCRSDRTATILPGNTNVFSISPFALPDWPRDAFPELRLAEQRMEAFAVGVKATPGCLEFKSIEVRHKREKENPRNNRK